MFGSKKPRQRIKQQPGAPNEALRRLEQRRREREDGAGQEGVTAALAAAAAARAAAAEGEAAAQLAERQPVLLWPDEPEKPQPLVVAKIAQVGDRTGMRHGCAAQHVLSSGGAVLLRSACCARFTSADRARPLPRCCAAAPEAASEGGAAILVEQLGSGFHERECSAVVFIQRLPACLPARLPACLHACLPCHAGGVTV